MWAFAAGIVVGVALAVAVATVLELGAMEENE